ncbi:MAG: sulfite exporter TauE/SafE family protein [Pseudomonadota bacterium]|jgi:hypothetical protein
MSVDLSTWLVSALAAFAVGLGKGGLAAMGTFGVPLMAQVMPPVRGAAILLPVFVFSDIFAVYLYRHQYSLRNMRILIPAATFGIALGWYFAARVSDREIEILVGLIGLSFCFNSWRQRHIKTPPHGADLGRGALWGTVLGFASFVAHAGSPPFQVYVQPQRLQKLVYAGTSAIVFAVVNALKLLPYWALGQFSSSNLQMSLALCVPALLGTQVAKHLVRVVSEKAYYRFLQVALAAVSVQLIYKGLHP